MEILILGYSNLVKRKIIPLFKNKLSSIKFSICSKSQYKKNIGALNWYRDYQQALKKSKADLVYISLPNSLHYIWAKKFLSQNFHVIIDKPATLKFAHTCELVKLAKKKKKLLSEAVVFNYHNQFYKALKEIKSLNNLIHIDARFVIPGFSKNDWHNIKKYQGGCLQDMSPYAAAIQRILFSSKSKNYKLITLKKMNKNNINENFTIRTIHKGKTFNGYFSHKGEYENTLELFTKYKSIKIDRVFSPPNNMNLTLKINKGIDTYERKIKRDDTFLKYLRKIIKLININRFEKEYQNVMKDSFFREKICLKKNFIEI